MKILKLSLFTFLTCFVMSCSTDTNFTEEEDSVTTTTSIAEADLLADADLIGTWIGIDVSYSGTITTDSDGITTIQDIEGSNFNGNYTITFSEDPNIITGEGLYTIEEEITDTSGNTSMNVIDNLNLITSSSAWNLIDDELTIDANGKITTTTVVENTSTTLVLTINENRSSTINGVTETVIRNSIFTFTR